MSEEKFVRGLIEKHAKTTGSTRAAKILKDWKLYRDKFRKVMPLEYRRVLEATAAGAAAS
jgi:glutamate synthase (NADPH/NADH) large chain